MPTFAEEFESSKPGETGSRLAGWALVTAPKVLLFASRPVGAGGTGGRGGETAGQLAPGGRASDPARENPCTPGRGGRASLRRHPTAHEALTQQRPGGARPAEAG